MSTRAILATLVVASLMLGGLTLYAAVSPGGLDAEGLTTFGSRGALAAFLREARASGFSLGWDMVGDRSTTTALALGEGASDFSGTNVQVAGVDEADIVKTDGTFVYVATAEEIVIVRAYPPEEMGVVSRIPLSGVIEGTEEGVRVVGLFLEDSRLIVLATSYGSYYALDGFATEELWPVPSETKTYLSLFDVEDPAAPVRLASYGISGSYVAARMTDGHVYAVAQSYIVEVDGAFTYPVFCSDSRCGDVALNRVLADPEAEGASSYVNLLALDVAGETASYLGIIAGYASTIYMSPDYLYLAVPKYQGAGVLPGPNNDLLAHDGQLTSIYRVQAEGLDLEVTGRGDVPGYLVNQFALDEHQGYLRVATTTGWMKANHVFVLDPGMAIVGALEGLAPGERIYSARFVGTALYLVTFKKVDPFFVIDLADPRNPEVLGYLKIPGFSEYLHPMDATHVLGVGKDTVEAEEGDFAWYQGLKLSFFDVSDVRDPQEVAKYLIGDRGTSSPVLWDHKAFLRIASRDLVVLPVELVVGEGDEPWAWGTPTWQGVYVLSVTPEEGFQLFGTVSHGEEDDDVYWQSPLSIQRSLYIGDYLYTLSPSQLQAHALEDLAFAGQLVFGTEA